jgi:hypothetical protein
MHCSSSMVKKKMGLFVFGGVQVSFWVHMGGQFIFSAIGGGIRNFLMWAGEC